ncbi:MAG TPA: hypothetical protein VGK74_18575 [Symbiobacteriaceae bacterium]
MLGSLMSWLPPEVWLALASVFTAGGIDALLSVLLTLTGKSDRPFEWRRVPQFLVSNVMWPAIGLVVTGALVKYYPDLRTGYLGVMAAADLWLAKDWRAKFNVLVGIKPSNMLSNR